MSFWCVLLSVLLAAGATSFITRTPREAPASEEVCERAAAQPATVFEKHAARLFRIRLAKTRSTTRVLKASSFPGSSSRVLKVFATHTFAKRNQLGAVMRC
jgi:hypothetical protein